MHFCLPRVLGLLFLFTFVPGANATLDSGAPIVVGLSADMSRGGARSGEAIRRGAMLAIDEINARGGVLGRRLELSVSDHRGIPARGADNIMDFSENPNVVAVLGGLHTPVAMAELKPVHSQQIVYLGPWAAGTGVVENGHSPNYVFRVSVRDEYAGEFLIKAAIKKGAKRPGLLLWNTAWGRSNETAMSNAINKLALPAAPVEWFNTRPKSVDEELESLYQQGVDTVMLVANPLDGVKVIRAMVKRAPDKRMPIISHWGITGGNFYDKIADVADQIDLTFLQTYSFFDPPFPEKSAQIQRRYCSMFNQCGPEKIISPVGTAHAYDLVKLLQKAIEQSGSTDRVEVRDALEHLDRHDGLVRVYQRAFTPDDHDALDSSDFTLAQYDKFGAIRPVTLD
ncbi:MAG: ABC transporter substrate-binding protein [Pseudomonadota bacterium]